jgi:hypothetical protein
VRWRLEPWWPLKAVLKPEAVFAALFSCLDSRY